MAKLNPGAHKTQHGHTPNDPRGTVAFAQALDRLNARELTVPGRLLLDSIHQAAVKRLGPLLGVDEIGSPQLLDAARGPDDGDALADMNMREAFVGMGRRALETS